MAIEDEIINISDLDLGNEILRNDKLIIETNNGTKLIDFKDFVIGLDNISFYHLISGSTETGGIFSEKIVGGYTLLDNSTNDGYKPDYKRLEGLIGLAESHQDAVSEFKSLSSTISQNNGDIQNILARLGQITALLEQPQEISLKTGGKLRLKKIKSFATANNDVGRSDGEWYDNLAADLEVVATGTDDDLVTIPARLADTTSSPVKGVNFKVNVTGASISIAANGNLPFNRQSIIPSIGTLINNPFKMTYPSSATDFYTTTIQYSAYIELEGSNLKGVPIEVYKDGNLVRKAIGTEISKDVFIYDFNFIEEVSIGDVILIKYGTGIGSNSTTAKIRPGSQFSGVRMI